MNTLIRNYKPPNDCVTCPFFKVNVANAGDGASLECKLLKQRFELVMLPSLRDERYPGCPMEEVEEPIRVSSRVSESYSWDDDTAMRITQKIVYQLDNQRSEEVCQHMDCDLSDFKEWLEEKKNKRKAND